MAHFPVNHTTLSIGKNDMGVGKDLNIHTDTVFYILLSNILILLKDSAVELDSVFVSEFLRAMCKMCGTEALLSQMIPVQFIV